MGVLDKITSAEFTETDLGVGTWRIVMPLPESGTMPQAWIKENWPYIEAEDTTTGWVFGGYVTSIKTERSATGEELIVSGKDYMGDLTARLAFPDPDNVLDFWETKVYGQGQILAAAQEIVRTNLFTSTDPRRFTFGSTLDNFPVSPNDIPEFDVVGDPILDMLKRWLFGTDYTFEARLNKEFAATPTILYQGRQRETSSRVLEADRLEADTITVDDAAATATDIILMGTEAVQGQPARWVTRDVSPISNWRYRPIEKFYNRPGTGLDTIFDEAAGLKREQLPRRTVSIEGLELDTYGLDVRLGDRVLVKLGRFWDYQTVSPVITSANITLEGEKVTRSISLDSPRINSADTLAQIIATMRRDLIRITNQAHKE